MRVTAQWPVGMVEIGSLETGFVMTCVEWAWKPWELYFLKCEEHCGVETGVPE